MKAIRLSITIVVGCCMLLITRVVAAQTSLDPLTSGFIVTPDSGKPHTWWHWMNGNVTKEGITLDLEAMKRVGIGGFQLFQVGSGIPKGPAPYGSPENTELVKWAAHEADRLGLEFAMHNCPGWSSSGGPWITPELSMQMLVMTETTAAGGQKLSVALAKPNANLDYYRDVFVIAFPTPSDGGARIANINSKANVPGGRGARGAAPTSEPSGTSAIDPASVIDISQYMNADGKLSWEAPAGNWTILRIGQTTTGVHNRPPPDGGDGLECDKFSSAAMDFHFNHFFGELFDAIKPLADKGMAGAVIDSYETGLQNWTGNFPQEFRKRTGYDIRNYMPAVFGRVVASPDKSERFLWDFRKVQANLMAENYYGRFAELCHEHGWKCFIEPYDPGNFDEMPVGRFADMPMGEFWQNQPNQHSIKLVASVAHINGRSIVGAESFTSQSRWTEYPYSLKALGDFMWTQGLNRFIFHRFAMQPNPTAVPGMTMGPWGGHFDRTNTWWDHGEAAWLQYVTRSQYLLQQGRFAADLLYFAGEDSPARTPQRPDLKPAVPAGYDFDTIDANSIETRLKIQDGGIVLPDGMSYRVMVFPDKKTVTLELIRKMRDLVQQGMTLVVNGPAQQNSPSLAGYPASNEEVLKIASELWGDLNGTTNTRRSVGAGAVIWGEQLPSVLAQLGAKPDFEYSAKSGDTQINFIHRRIAKLDRPGLIAQPQEVYFVANRSEQLPADIVCTFNVSGMRPEFWDAASGQVSPVNVYDIADGRTRIPLQLPPSGSMFVVFRAPPPQGMGTSIQMVMKDGLPLANVEPFTGRPTSGPTSLPRGGGGSRTQNVMPMPRPSEPGPISLSAGPLGGLLAWQDGAYAVSDTNKQTKTLEVTGLPKPLEIEGPWHVTFPPNLGAPPEATFDKLISWTDSPENGVKYFSGTATYSKKITIPSEMLADGRQVFLDLGRVLYVADVSVNGIKMGTLWKVPFMMDITPAVRAGENDLQIQVTNLWPNRLIGDEQLPPENQYNAAGGRGGTANAISAMPDWFVKGLPKPADSKRIAFTTWHHWNANSPLIDSGLIGPVMLRSAVRIPVER